MPSPFPGMDPYLENPALWPNVHGRLIVAIADALSPLLLPKYQPIIEEAVYRQSEQAAVMVGMPDVVVQKASQKAGAGSESAEVAVAIPFLLTIVDPLILAGMLLRYSGLAV